MAGAWRYRNTCVCFLMKRWKIPSESLHIQLHIWGSSQLMLRNKLPSTWNVYKIEVQFQCGFLFNFKKINNKLIFYIFSLYEVVKAIHKSLRLTLREILLDAWSIRFLENKMFTQSKSWFVKMSICLQQILSFHRGKISSFIVSSRFYILEGIFLQDELDLQLWTSKKWLKLGDRMKTWFVCNT